MTDKEKLIKIKSLADKMFDTAFNMTTDAGLLRKAMDEYHQFIINEYHKEEQIINELQCEQNNWSEEDEDTIKFLISHFCTCHPTRTFQFTTNKVITNDELLRKIRHLKHQTIWKPSEEMLEALYKVIPQNVMAISEDEMLLDKLYQGLKYGKVLSEK